MLSCIGSIYEISAPTKVGQKCSFVSAKFSPNGRSYDYLFDNKEINLDDIITVYANDSKKEVTAVNKFLKTEFETAMPTNSYKRI